MINAYRKHKVYTCFDERDHSWWRRAPFEEMRCDSLQNTVSCKNENSSVNTLSTLKEASLAYTKFQRLDQPTLKEVSIMSAIRLDAVKTAAVDSLEQTFEGL